MVYFLEKIRVQVHKVIKVIKVIKAIRVPQVLQDLLVQVLIKL
jgi:hypothetical protein